MHSMFTSAAAHQWGDNFHGRFRPVSINNQDHHRSVTPYKRLPCGQPSEEPYTRAREIRLLLKTELSASGYRDLDDGLLHRDYSPDLIGPFPSTVSINNLNGLGPPRVYRKTPEPGMSLR